VSVERFAEIVAADAGRRIDAQMRLDFNDFGDRHEVAPPADGDVKDVTGEWQDYETHFTG
jgi:hypothetical protein